MSGKTARWSVGVSGGSLSHLTIPEIAATAVALGTPSVELNWGQNFSSLAEAGEARRRLDAAGVAIPVTNTFMFRARAELDDPDGALATFATCLDAARTLGSSRVLIYCPCSPRDLVPEATHLAEVERFTAVLRRCADLCEAAGVTLVIENHADWLLRSVDETVRLLAAEPRLRMAFDPANYYSSGEEAFPRAYGLLRDRVSVVHVKDPARYDARLYPGERRTVERTVRGTLIKGLFLDLGEGAINWDGLLRRLSDDGFDGPLILEPYTEKPLLGESLSHAADYLRRKAAATGM